MEASEVPEVQGKIGLGSVQKLDYRERSMHAIQMKTNEKA